MRGASILAALANAVLLLTVTGGIAWEAVLRLIATPHVGGATVMVIAAGGILVNGGTALLFMRGQNDLNVRGAFLHMVATPRLPPLPWLRAPLSGSLIGTGSTRSSAWSLLAQS